MQILDKFRIEFCFRKIFDFIFRFQFDLNSDAIFYTKFLKKGLKWPFLAKPIGGMSFFLYLKHKYHLFSSQFWSGDGFYLVFSIFKTQKSPLFQPLLIQINIALELSMKLIEKWNFSSFSKEVLKWDWNEIAIGI